VNGTAYLSYPSVTMPPETPVKVLRGFEKVTVEPGTDMDVKFPLRRRDLSFWDSVHPDWRIPEGQF
jgi:beta-glucosidase